MVHLACSETSGTNVRSALREATREVHERLHQHPNFAALLDGTLTVTSYRRLLARLYGFHRPYEDVLLSLPSQWWHGLNPEPRRRAYRLAEDLAALGLTSSELSALPFVPPPAIECCEELLGCLYVREGATLGGRVLARRLEPMCWPNGAGRSFFSGTAQDSMLWAELCLALDRIGNKQNISAMTGAACATFAAFEAWLNSDHLVHGER